MATTKKKPAQSRDPDPPAPALDDGFDEVPEVRMLTARQVMERIQVTWPTLWAWSKKGKFPPPREVSVRKIMWVEKEVNEWLASRPVAGTYDR